MVGRLSHKGALVTGRNGGIGLATAKRFVAEGVFVASLMEDRTYVG